NSFSPEARDTWETDELLCVAQQCSNTNPRNYRGSLLIQATQAQRLHPLGNDWQQLQTACSDPPVTNHKNSTTEWERRPCGSSAIVEAAPLWERRPRRDGRHSLPKNPKASPRGLVSHGKAKK